MVFGAGTVLDNTRVIVTLQVICIHVLQKQFQNKTMKEFVALDAVDSPFLQIFQIIFRN